MDVSIIVISYNTRALLRACLTSVRDKTCGVDYEIFVVDNASNDNSYETVEIEFPEVHLIKNRENVGYSKANNQAIVVANGEYVLLLNSDTVLENNAVRILYEFMQTHPQAAVCGPLLLNADKTVQRSIATYHSTTSMVLRLILGANHNRYWRLLRDKYHPGAFDYLKRYQITDGWLTGAVLMIRKAVLSESELLDETYHFMMEDADWGLTVSRSGWESWLVPEAMVMHLLGGSRQSLSRAGNLVESAGLRQHRYYVRKNLGLVRYGIYRSVVMCIYVMNVIRRVIVAAFSSTEKRSRAIFKSKLGWQMLLASMEIGGKRSVEDRQ
jgi:GT2 family glycosyltransferase